MLSKKKYRSSSQRVVAWGSAQFQRQYWNPHWNRVEEDDEQMKIGPWVARKRKALWQARFTVTVANCNARMIN
jgi:hypothetical protein